MTYSALVANADEVAATLAEAGVDSGMAVGICIERSIERVVAMLGTLRAGAAFLPLDPDWPLERIRRVLDDAGAPVVVADPRFAAALAMPNRRVLGSRLKPRRGVRTKSFAALHGDTLAYVIYTSGSSGEPKGVEITHSNLANLVGWHRETFAISAVDRTSWVAGLGFDASVWEVFPYLAAGAEIRIPEEPMRLSAERLRRWLIDESISIAFAPTPLAEAMIRMAWPTHTTLRILLTGGDTLHVWPKPGLPFKLVNNYGPTECTVVATSGVVTPQAEASGLPAIGRPIANTRIRILGREGRPTRPGEIGEIYVAGAGVGRGYRNRPSHTAERFVTLSEPGKAMERYYRTGDLGCWTTDGEIAFHGRSDDQLKIRGHRIEPDEISAALSGHPSLAQSAIIAEGDGVDRRLVAYIVSCTEKVPSGRELRDFLATRLPDYMLPTVFVRVAALPLSPNGKLDRAALPRPAPENILPSTGYRAPETPVEARIAAIVEELLGISGVGVDDNFFLLGGHSLLGTQLVLRVRDAFGTKLTLRDLFEAPTVKNLAARVERTAVDMVASMSEEELEQRLVHQA